MRKNEVSIIIPAWNADNWINDCLQSIYEQSWSQDENNKWEILVGIDNCEKTKLSVTPQKNTRVFYFENNYGPYIVRNTLAYKFAEYSNLLFFDSDDLMHPDLIKDCFLVNKDLIIFQYLLNQNIKYSFGPSFVKKKLLLKFGGYANWVCAADSDFIRRLEKGHNRWFKLTGKNYMYRRIHDTQLTSNPETGLRSKIRREYRLKTDKKIESNNLINKPKFGELTELDFSDSLNELKQSDEYLNLITQIVNSKVDKFIGEYYIICAFSTKTYINNINKLKSRLDLIGCEYNIIYLNTNSLRKKPNIILDVLLKYKKPILYLDIDSLLNEKPIFYIKRFDIGFINGSNIKLFNNTKNTIEYLEAWCRLNVIFSKTIKLNEHLNINWLNQMCISGKHKKIKLTDIANYINI